PRNRIRSGQHRFRLATRGSHGPTIQMIAPHYHGSFHFPTRDKFIQRKPKFVAFTVTQPANSRRQPLKLHALLGQFDPAHQVLVVRKHFEDELVRPRDVGGLARKRRPAEWSFAFTKKRTDIRRHKSRKVVSVFHA